MIYKQNYKNQLCIYCYQPICVCPDEKYYKKLKNEKNILRTKKLKRILDDQYELQDKQIKKHDTI